MPGGRLTQQERQQIALGLAEDLAYAEIARRLDRPTSTVTREVMRNGGPNGYRADLAHRATEHRAQRRQALPRNPYTDRSADGRDPEAVAAYAETVTTVFMHSGMSRMPARVLAALMLTDEGCLSAVELAQRLQVSPASISKAVAFLDEQAMIRRERDERRRERYVLDDDIWYQATVASAQANAAVVEAVSQGVSVLGPGTPASDRLDSIARFLGFVSDGLFRLAEEAREIQYATSGGNAAAAEDAVDGGSD